MYIIWDPLDILIYYIILEIGNGAFVRISYTISKDPFTVSELFVYYNSYYNNVVVVTVRVLNVFTIAARTVQYTGGFHINIIYYYSRVVHAVDKNISIYIYSIFLA